MRDDVDKIVVLDPGMMIESGHHRPYNKAIEAACQEKGVACSFMFSGQTPTELWDDFENASAPFSFWHYELHPDPVSGDLEEYIFKSQTMRENLNEFLTPLTDSRTTVFMHTGKLYALFALSMWQSSLPEGQKPHIFINFFDYAPSDLFQACLKFAADFIKDDPRVFLLAGCKSVAEKISAFSGFRVRIMPAPLTLGERSALFRPEAEPVLGFVSEGRPEKNIHILAPAVREYLCSGGKGRFHFQIVPTYKSVFETTNALRSLADDFPDRVEFEQGYVTTDRYYDILSGLDAILLPYTPALYRSSGLVQEALALGVSPLVVRGGSQMLEAARIGAGFAMMTEPSVQALLEAIRGIVRDYASLREKSVAASKQYRKYHSHSNLVDTLLFSDHSVTAEGMFQDSAPV